jgi:phosphoglucosamine mutase
MAKYFGTDGIRGIAGDSLTEDFVRRAGFAIGEVLRASYRGHKLPIFHEVDGCLPHPAILLGRDTRTSSPSLAKAVAEGLESAGVNVVDLGIVPTPLIGLLTNRFNAIGGVMITASHNPVEYNGIKVFHSNGLKLGDEAVERTERIIDRAKPRNVSCRPMKLDAHPYYIQHLRQLNRLHGGGAKVALDMAHGAACGLAEEVFTGFGFNIVPVCAKPDGARINVQCGATHLAKLQAEVKRSGAAWGFAFDGDADRLMAVDGQGRAVNGDMLLALLVLEHRPYRKAGRIVFTEMSNAGVERHLREHGIRTHRTVVGDQPVLRAMRRLGVLLGGEQSGHIICLDKTCGGDGILVALFVSELLTREGISLAEFADGIPVFPQILRNMHMRDHLAWQHDDNFRKQLHALERHYHGVRVYIRPSGTEKLVRILTEAQDAVLAQQANDDAASLFAAYSARNQHHGRE